MLTHLDPLEPRCLFAQLPVVELPRQAWEVFSASPQIPDYYALRKTYPLPDGGRLQLALDCYPVYAVDGSVKYGSTLIYRVHDDGTPDSTFANGEGLSLPQGFVVEQVHLLADQHLMLVGRQTYDTNWYWTNPNPDGYDTEGSTPDSAAAYRIDLAGRPDTSFGHDGMVTIDGTFLYRPEPVMPELTAVTLDASDRLVALFRPYWRNDLPAELWRLTPEGLPDRSFGTKGRARVRLDAWRITAPIRLLTDADSRIYLSDCYNDYLGTYGVAAVLRLTSVGQPDAEWGPRGWRQLTPPASTIPAYMYSSLQDLWISGNQLHSNWFAVYRKDPITGEPLLVFDWLKDLYSEGYELQTSELDLQPPAKPSSTDARRVSATLPNVPFGLDSRRDPSLFSANIITDDDDSDLFADSEHDFDTDNNSDTDRLNESDPTDLPFQVSSPDLTAVFNSEQD